MSRRISWYNVNASLQLSGASRVSALAYVSGPHLIKSADRGGGGWAVVTKNTVEPHGHAHSHTLLLSTKAQHLNSVSRC